MNTWNGSMKELDGRYRCLIREPGGHGLRAVVLCSSQLSPSRERIYLGDFYNDEVKGWYAISAIEVQEVLKEIVLPREFDPCSIRCAFGFHSWERLPSPPGVMRGVGAPLICKRCGDERPGLPYPKAPELSKQK